MMKTTLLTLTLIFSFGISQIVEAKTPIKNQSLDLQDPAIVNQLTQNTETITIGKAADLITLWLNAKSRI
ncbi:MAG: ARC6/PARC6 family protein, partial [Planktothrix sp.]